MRFHGIMVLRDEGDIIAQTLPHLLTWVDSLSLLDNGSTDDTWAIVNEFARRDKRVVPVAREETPYHNGLRAVLFDRVRRNFEDGDWFARLDADEIYHVPPPQFVRERLAPHESRVFAQLYEFLMTKAQHRAWEAGDPSLGDRTVPIESRLTRFVVQDFPEPRLFRYRRSMRWPADSYVPLRGGLIAQARIPVRHYRWRDPEQAARRCALRNAARAAGALTGPHWTLADYRDWLANDEDPGLLTWSPGEELPNPRLTNHLPRSSRGLHSTVQRFVYRSGLVRVLDRLDLRAGERSGSLTVAQTQPANGPAFHNLLLVRDEADIIEQNLKHLLTWCDAVHIYDTGSTDGTWEIVNELARRDARIRPVAREEVFYSDSLRAMLFDRVRGSFRRGDWIARFDADEFAHVHPPIWIAENLSRIESLVRALFFEFVIRQSDVTAGEAGTEHDALPGRAKTGSLEDRRWYYVDPHPEYRLFRYRSFMKWPHDRAIPLSCGLTAYERLPIRHYRCRDIAQVQRRCAMRAALAEHAAGQSGAAAHAHWKQDWRYWIWPDADPRLRRWEPGTDLPVPRSARAARGTLPHVLRQLCHGSGAVHAADIFRAGFDQRYKPMNLPPELQRELAAPYPLQGLVAAGRTIPEAMVPRTL